jgi:hypothetical protein
MTLEGDAPARRAACRSMLGDQRIRVLADQERENGFRVEGLLSIDLSPPPGLAKLIAGGRSCTCSPPSDGRRRQTVSFPWGREVLTPNRIFVVVVLAAADIRSTRDTVPRRTGRDGPRLGEAGARRAAPRQRDRGFPKGRARANAQDDSGRADQDPRSHRSDEALGPPGNDRRHDVIVWRSRVHWSLPAILGPSGSREICPVHRGPLLDPIAFGWAELRLDVSALRFLQRWCYRGDFRRTRASSPLAWRCANATAA